MAIPAERLRQYATADWLRATLQDWEISCLLPSAVPTLTEERPYATIAGAKKRELSLPDVQVGTSADTAAETARVVKQMRLGSGVKIEGGGEKAFVHEWFATYNAEGRAGNIGLVPEPIRHAYPSHAPNVLDGTTRLYVEHFCAWFVRNKL
jgi:hypothetical protein